MTLRGTDPESYITENTVAYEGEALHTSLDQDAVAEDLEGDHSGVDLRADLKSISHRCHRFEVVCVWELTKETVHLPLGCLQGGVWILKDRQSGGTRSA